MELCLFWAMFQQKVKWDKFNKRKEVYVATRGSSRSTRNKQINYADEPDEHKSRRNKRKTSSEEEEAAIL